MLGCRARHEGVRGHRTRKREHLDLVLVGQTAHLAAMWRRDLLLVSGAQFFALAAAVAALVALG
jgi:hypothetical protein